MTEAALLHLALRPGRTVSLWVERSPRGSSYRFVLQDEEEIFASGRLLVEEAQP